ncbi:MAG: T9SS type A sorting domain-containing protein [Calditrichaceae bacterium]|nr:T9SS type A sorting domain-containing protein [Calditrichaceae bacterium]
MQLVNNCFLLIIIFCLATFAQVTGLVDDFNDNTLTGWEVPASQTAGTFSLTEADSVLRIDYNRNAESYEWDNFNFTPDSTIQVTTKPLITLRAKSNVGTVLTFKPAFAGEEVDWLQVTLPSDELWHNYTFEISAAPPVQIDRIYMYLDGGSTELRSGVIYFDDMRMGDSVRAVDMLDKSKLEALIINANALYDNAIEGSGEGEFEPGSKTTLKSYISAAENFIDRADITMNMIDSTIWVLADACVTFETGVNASDIGLIDPLATKETKYLYVNLDDLKSGFLIFGMHDATGYGVGWTGDDDRSDVKDVCGSYPALYSEDFNKLEKNEQVDRMRYRLTTAYNRGGIITMSWHQFDPQFRGFYAEDTQGDNVVATILPGGVYHQFYKDKLHTMAFFLKTLRGTNGESIPVIFRPYHEHTGAWFWWGVGNCTTNQYNEIWQFTVEYLRDSLNVHNLIYAISPSAQHIDSQNDYYNIYPGDDYVDIFGMDKYFGDPITSAEYYEFVYDLQRIAQNADDKAKVAALTEVGQEAIPTTNLFTHYFLDPVQTDTITTKISYAAVWRNSTTTHHFAPYPGHPSVPDFIKFYEDPTTLFEDNLPDMYSLITMDETPPEVLSYPDEPFTAYYTEVPIDIKTNERAFLRYSFTDQLYSDMPYSFETGQGSFDHTTVIKGNQGDAYHLFIRAADYNDNVMDESIEVTFSIDTLKRPVYWNEEGYATSDWQSGHAPFHFEDGSQTGTTVEYSRTVYLRKTFSVNNIDSLLQMVAFIKFDNGFVMYINGQEVRRVYMSYGDVDYNTWAENSTQTSINVTLDKTILGYMHDGDNVIALEVHQSMSDSSDLKFDLQLIDPSVRIAYESEWYYYAEGKAPDIKTLDASDINEDFIQLPNQPELAQNYPNPFNPSTTIKFALTENGPVNLIIYDLTGRRVAELLNNKMQTGWHSVEFDGHGLASGIYLYRLITEQGSLVRKMVLLK